MITRYALFEGKIHDGQENAFRAAVTAEILPLWRQFPNALSVRVTYAIKRDDGAPEFPMILTWRQWMRHWQARCGPRPVLPPRAYWPGSSLVEFITT